MTKGSANFNRAYDYLYHKALSDRNKAELSLNLLMNNGVGIGDHSTEDYWSNLDSALDTLVDAEDRLDILSQFSKNESNEPPPF